jgi:hypothetical protein
MTPSRRLPDFVVIGAGKSGTTTLHRWLAAQPDVFQASVKEPRFFSQHWDNGLDWYADLFAGAAPDELAGEASTNYTDPRYDEVVAFRMAEILPNARLVYLVRHPIERLRSQYRYHLRRAVVSAPLREAVREPHNLYLGRSLYATRLQPFITRFAREQLLVVRFEDLVGDNATAWNRILHHLGLPARPRPETAHNVTDDKHQVSRPLAWLRDRGVLDRSHLLPRSLRRAAKSALIRPAAPDADNRVDLSIPDDVVQAIWDDAARLEDWLGVSEPLWPRSASTVPRS